MRHLFEFFWIATVLQQNIAIYDVKQAAAQITDIYSVFKLFSPKDIFQRLNVRSSRLLQASATPGSSQGGDRHFAVRAGGLNPDVTSHDKSMEDGGMNCAPWEVQELERASAAHKCSRKSATEMPLGPFCH